MIDWIIENKEWLFSGIAIAIPLAIISWLIRRNQNRQIQKSGENSTNTIEEIDGKLSLFAMRKPIKAMSFRCGFNR